MPGHRYECPHCDLGANTDAPAILEHHCRPPGSTKPKRPTRFVEVTKDTVA